MAHLLAILAHADDEALLCGGLLMAARDAGHRITICICTDPRFCNRIERDEAAETSRIEARIAGFHHVYCILQAHGRCFGLQNRIEPGTEMFIELYRQISGAVYVFKPDAIVTHGSDTLHPQHLAVYNCVKRCAAEIPLILTWRSESGRYLGKPIWSLEYDDRKRELVDCYRHGMHVPNWDPFSEPEWRDWCSGYEHFLPFGDEGRAREFLESLGATACSPQTA